MTSQYPPPAPNWTDDVPHTGAEFGKVDQLHSIDNLQYSSAPITLGIGTYVATCRLMKYQDGVGAADIDFAAVRVDSAEVMLHADHTHGNYLFEHATIVDERLTRPPRPPPRPAGRLREVGGRGCVRRAR